MPKVVMYSTRFCPYCVRARMLLEKKGVDFTDIRVDHEPQLRDEMITRAGRSSGPIQTETAPRHSPRSLSMMNTSAVAMICMNWSSKASSIKNSV